MESYESAALEREVRERLRTLAYLSTAAETTAAGEIALSALSGFCRSIERGAGDTGAAGRDALPPITAPFGPPTSVFPGLPSDPAVAVSSALTAIAEDTHRAFIHLDAAGARAHGRGLTAVPARWRGSLHGLPIAVKDNIEVANWPVTAGSATRAGIIAERDSPAAGNLRAAGAIVVGTTNMDELAWGATTTNPAYGATVNPLNPARSVGGSSGGSAAAVALGLVRAAIGSDTGGSVRLPAAACGVVGFRPSTGLIDATGVIPLAPSYDVVGPIAETVAAARTLAEVTSGRQLPSSAVPSHLRIGTIAALTPYGTDDVVSTALASALQLLEHEGAEIVPLTLPHPGDNFDVWFLIHLIEPALAHRALVETRGDALGPAARIPLLAGLALPERLIETAQQLRAAFVVEIEDLLAHVDVVVAPTMAFAPPLTDADEIVLPAGRIPLFQALPAATWLASMAGLPAVSVPLRADDMPVGLQVMGPRNADARVLDVAEWIEKLLAQKASV